MKKIIYGIVVLVVLAVAAFVGINYYGSSGTNDLEFPRQGYDRSAFGDAEAPGPAFDISVSDLEKFLNEHYAYTLPPGNKDRLFTEDLKATDKIKDFGDAVYEIFDFTGDGKNDAMVEVPYRGQDFNEFYVFTTDAKVVPEFDNFSGKINLAVSTNAVNIGRETMRGFGPGKTITFPCMGDACRMTLGWSEPDRDGYKKIIIKQ